METVTNTLTFRGTEAYHFIAYFEKVADAKKNQGYLLEGVEITVMTLAPHRIGSLEITQVALTLHGEIEQVHRLVDGLRKYFMTAGG